MSVVPVSADPVACDARMLAAHGGLKRPKPIGQRRAHPIGAALMSVALAVLTSCSSSSENSIPVISVGEVTTEVSSATRSTLAAATTTEAPEVVTTPSTSAAPSALTPTTTELTAAPTTTATANAANLLGEDELDLLRCTNPSEPAPGLMESTEFSCTGDGGGPGTVVVPRGSSLAATVQAYMDRPDYNENASTFIARTDGSYFVFAPSDFDFWGEYPFADASFFDFFDAVDTDCLDPSTNDPLLCG